MNLTSLQAWIRKPTNVIGISSGIGIVAHMIAQATAGQIGWPVAIGGIAFSIVCVAIPDNSGAQSSVEKLVTDAVTAAMQKKVSAAIPSLVQDGMAVFTAFTAPAPAQSAMNSAPAQNSAPSPGATQAPNPAAPVAAAA